MIHDEALIIRVDWKRVRTDQYVEARFIDGPNAAFKAIMDKCLHEYTEPGYSYVVVVREPFETKGVG